MVGDWRAEACAEVSQMTAAERNSYLVALGYADVETNLERSKSAASGVTNPIHSGPRPRGRPKGSVSVKRRSELSENESANSRSSSQSVAPRRATDRSGAFGLALAARKRKSTVIPRSTGPRVLKVK